MKKITIGETWKELYPRNWRDKFTLGLKYKKGLKSKHWFGK